MQTLDKIITLNFDYNISLLLVGVSVDRVDHNRPQSVNKAFKPRSVLKTVSVYMHVEIVKQLHWFMWASAMTLLRSSAED